VSSRDKVRKEEAVLVLIRRRDVPSSSV
jgi:hypothetical protein